MSRWPFFDSPTSCTFFMELFFLSLTLEERTEQSHSKNRINRDLAGLLCMKTRKTMRQYFGHDVFPTLLTPPNTQAVFNVVAHNSLCSHLPLRWLRRILLSLFRVTVTVSSKGESGRVSSLSGMSSMSAASWSRSG